VAELRLDVLELQVMAKCLAANKSDAQELQAK
jgi:hypothetical protein